MRFYKFILRPILFLFDPEFIHHTVFKFLKLTFLIPGIAQSYQKLFVLKEVRLEKNLMGIRFPNPVGLAAGFDKNAELTNELSALGFGFVEIGTVTPLAQSGNEKPRMFRLPDDEAIINRMGFNNDGAEVISNRLRTRNPGIIIGGNIGKNRNTPNERAVDDYELCFRKLYNQVDYFAVNVSSPNTPGLRELQDKAQLVKILFRLQEINKQLFEINRVNKNQKRLKPVLLKIAPDLSNQQLDEIIAVVVETNLDGIIATNTTISRESLRTSSAVLQEIGAGGLSGRPLTKRSTEVIRYLAERSGGKYIIIGVGGIHDAGDALEKLGAGASLIQLYTGFIYSGPLVIREINRGLLNQS